MSADPWDDYEGPQSLLGDHNLTVVSFKTGKSNTKQTPYVEFTLEDGPVTTKVTFYTTEAARWRFIRFCRSAGANKADFAAFNFERFTEEWDDTEPSRKFLRSMLGAPVNCRFDWQKPNYQGEVYSGYVTCWGADVKAPAEPFVVRPKPAAEAPKERGQAAAGAKRPDTGGPRAQAAGPDIGDDLPF